MRELVLLCPEERAEALSDALLEAGMLSVSVEDADSNTEAERALFGEPGLEPDVQAWHRNRVVALMPDGLDPAQVIEVVREAGLGDYGDGEWLLRDVPDEDWVRLTQSQFPPIQVAGRIWIVPSWHRNSPDVPPVSNAAGADEALHIELDPGLAFGTGSHPTTHLCLAWLERHIKGHETVLDYGCGSGILAIAAKMLGAASITAVDIDEQAVQSTRQNASINGVQLQAMLPDALAEGQFQIVVANILSNPLKVLAPMLANRVAPGGHLALSGVLERQADEVALAYAPWLKLEVWQEREGWVCLHGQRVH
ncbi:50S ribosomal protein L11 methyltransferase [Allopusillimonas ginsengisoli]|uniref:50S ribosomal protein L11 methyltransferase n=1 Tax=Allopusillimonas ginsengisoli TaxID=453575 RepID=UPI0010C1A96A|nr:50S ribosomal protein L11 methyltransferase [Allopusillimonas ginsengisoli]